MGKTGQGLIALLLAATIAYGETEAELLKRVQSAFRKYDTTDGTLKSLRMDVTMPMFGTPMRIRAAYQAPDRYSMVAMSAHDLTPIAIARERGTLMYNAARGKALIDKNTGAPFLVLDVGEDAHINFRWGFSQLSKGASKTDGFVVSVPGIASLSPNNKRVRRVGKLLAYSAISNRGSRFLAWFRDTPQPTLARIELWGADLKRPLLVIENIEFNTPIPAAAFPVIRAEDWAKVLPIGSLDPDDAAEQRNELATEVWGRNFLASALSSAALVRLPYRELVLPEANGQEWEAIQARCQKETPRVRARWQTLYGAASPRADGANVIELDALEPESNDPIEQQIARAVPIIKLIENRTSNDEEFGPLVIFGHGRLDGVSIFDFDATFDADTMHVKAWSGRESRPLAVAHKGSALLFDAANGRLLALKGTRPEIRLRSYKNELRVELDLLSNSPARPRINLPFADILGLFPDARRAYVHPNVVGAITLTAEHPNRGQLYFVCAPKKVPVVREVWLRTSKQDFAEELLSLREPLETDRMPPVAAGAFRGIVPVKPIDLTPALWTILSDGEENVFPPLYYLAIQRMALHEDTARAYIPGFGKQHWAAFAQREEELTPKVVEAWRKAFGGVR